MRVNSKTIDLGIHAKKNSHKRVNDRAATGHRLLVDNRQSKHGNRMKRGPLARSPLELGISLSRHGVAPRLGFVGTVSEWGQCTVTS